MAVALPVLFRCTEPCGHMCQTQMDVCLRKPRLQPVQDMLGGKASESVSPLVVMHPPNKPSCSCTTLASMKLLTGPSTLDSPVLYVAERASSSPLTSDVSTVTCLLIVIPSVFVASVCFLEPLVSNLYTSARAGDKTILCPCRSDSLLMSAATQSKLSQTKHRIEDDGWRLLSGQ